LANFTLGFLILWASSRIIRYQTIFCRDIDLTNVQEPQKDEPGTAIIPVDPKLPVKRDDNEIVLVNPNPPVPVPNKKRRRVVSSVKKYISTHKKAILISLAIATLLLLLPQIYPAMATSLMAQNAALWHIAPQGVQTLLHGTNVVLAKTLELMGMSSSFVEATGVWTIGGIKGIGSVFAHTLAGSAVKSAIVGVLGGGALKLVKDKMPETIEVGKENIDKEVTEEELMDFLNKTNDNYKLVSKHVRNITDEQTKEKVTEEINEFRGLEKVSLLTALKEKFRKTKEKREQETVDFVPEYEDLLDEMLKTFTTITTYEEFNHYIEVYNNAIDNFTAYGKTSEQNEILKQQLRDYLEKRINFEESRFYDQRVERIKEEFEQANDFDELNEIFARYKNTIKDDPHLSNEEKIQLLETLREEIRKAKKEMDDLNQGGKKL